MFTSTNKFLIISTLVFFAAVGGLGYLYWLIRTDGQELLATMQLVADDQSAHENSQVVLDAFAESENRRTQLESYILNDDEDTANLLSLVEAVAAEQGVTVSTDKLQVVETEDKDFDDLSVRFKLEGPGDNVKRLISLIETLPYKQQVNELTLRESIDETTGLTRANAEIALVISIKAGNI